MITLTAILLILLSKQQQYTFNSTINVERMSKLLNMNKSSLLAKYPKEKAYRTI